ncbi:FAD binding domain-containing protein [Ilyonectria robusta]|uniref:FAD binding domain-containing protein n=1 Tax=Ilyonectria robusta TaxID=1079257 RepID=UPI001E8DD390|nr:FAD binding domain-containing protein [Ilyonectria robusta]KAH8661730.1 FAD binding domain-containing protein [Ilyonectria robusta]
MAPKNFTVLITGGGIAGLTLANLLERVGIDFIILEAYREIAPQVGASIGIMPNGSRVLDQIGLYDDIRSRIEQPLLTSLLRDSSGKVLSKYRGYGDQNKDRYGYDVIFVDRQMVLQALWRNLKNKDKVHVSKKVTRVSLERSGVTVETSDGQFFSGDILVGADGVHSKVRSEMWRLADAMKPGYIPASEHTECLPTVYKCIFGISVMKDWDHTAIQTNLNKNFSYLIIGGPNDRVYWFLLVNMGQTYRGKEPPRFTKQDEEALVNEHRNDRIAELTTFQDLYSKKVTSVLTALPEYVFKKWHFNRIMTIGDAAHKLEPIAGQGGNSAIETAAVLVNNLVLLLKAHPSGVTTAEINAAFAETQEKREPRVSQLVRASHEDQRFAALESPMAEFIARYIIPGGTIDDKLHRSGARIEGGHKLDILDVPKKRHFIPYHDELPGPRQDSPGLLRLVLAAVLCGIIYTAEKTLALSTGPRPSKITFLGDTLKKTFTGIPQVDARLSGLVWGFSQSITGPDPNTRLQCVYFIVSMLPAVYIWTLEAYRNGNTRSPVSWPSVFTIAQLVGIGKIAPLYFLITLWTSSGSIYTRPTGRPIPSLVAKALLPALCIGYVLPTALMLIQYGDSVAQQNAIAFWQASTLYVPVLTWTSYRIFQQVAPTKSLDWELFENKDLPYLQAGYAFTFFTCAITHICTLVYAYNSPTVSLSKAIFSHLTFASFDFGDDIIKFWKWDMFLYLVTVVIWCFYSVYELRRLGYVSTRTVLVAGATALAAQVVVGPAATYAGLWYWREGVIAGMSKAF